MALDQQYQADWNEYRRRRRLELGIALTLPLAVLVVGVPLGQHFVSDVPVILVAGIWLIALFHAGFHRMSWCCPRCAKPFFEAWFYYNAFAGQCVHCGLPKWSCDPDAH